MAATSRNDHLLQFQHPEVDLVRILAAFALLTAFGVTGGPLGIVGGVLVAGASFVLAAPVTIALGHVVLLGVLPDPSALQLAALEFGFVLVLVAPATDLAAPVQTAGVTVLAFLGLAGILTGALTAVDDLWVVCGLLVAVVATVAYGLYRYELVQRGLVDTDTEGMEGES